MDAIMNFLNSLDFEMASNFLDEASKHSVIDWTIKIGIVWFIMGRKVNARFTDFQVSLSAHFEEIEKGFAGMVREMKELKENVSKDLSKHSQILGGLTTEIGNIKTRVDKLENQKGQQ